MHVIVYDQSGVGVVDSFGIQDRHSRVATTSNGAVISKSSNLTIVLFLRLRAGSTDMQA